MYSVNHELALTADVYFKLIICNSILHFLKIINNCGIVFQVISMVNIQIYFVCLNTGDSHPKQITYSLEITLIEENSHWKQFVSYSHTKLNIQKTSFCYVETMNVPASTESMVFTMNVSEAI